MSYLEDFKTQINNRDFSKILQLWEEYCSNDIVDVPELKSILEVIKKSDFAVPFGKVVETALLLWQMITDSTESYTILRLILDIETTNSPLLADTAYNALKNKYGDDPYFEERIRLVGLRNREDFQGCLSNYDLLVHMKKNNFVFHQGGWGTGEIVDISPVREQLAIEFENVSGQKHITFSNAFKLLIPLEKDSFLARRFGDPDTLEEEARKDPVPIIRILLRDLGPKTAAEIKDELCDLVIPEKDWTKWWQWARSKVKKDAIIESPAAFKDPFRLRNEEISPEERLHKALHCKLNTDEIIQKSYNLVRDMPTLLKNEQIRHNIEHKLEELLRQPELTPEQRLQIHIFLENLFDKKVGGITVEELVQENTDLENIINRIEIIAFKKRALLAVKEYRPDWVDLFLNMLFSVQQSQLRDYILKELQESPQGRAPLEARLSDLMKHPHKAPEIFVWYFQKLLAPEGEKIPFKDQDNLYRFFESFMILLSILENNPQHRELTKKMYNILSGKRYATVRAILENVDLAYIKEFLLLVSKCQTFSDHDRKILQSLAEVVHPSLAGSKKKRSALDFDGQTVWTTETGYLKMQERIRELTVEVVDNAKEIEAARALGDLRENSEYKFALERRSRLQNELKHLSEQLNRARIITPNDVHHEEIGIGSIVELENSHSQRLIYTILGPWDADVESHVLSFQSKLAQAMIGYKIGDKFQFRDDEFNVVGLKSFLDK